jgi:HEPN domain-containing protein
MAKDPEEWLKQADYDWETAQTLLTHGRPQFAMFVCHLAVEKALKGLYHKRLNRVPPKVHNLIYFLKELDLDVGREQYRILARLNEAQIAARYPDELGIALERYKGPKVAEILRSAKEAIEWIKKQF